MISGGSSLCRLVELSQPCPTSVLRRVFDLPLESSRFGSACRSYAVASDGYYADPTGPAIVASFETGCRDGAYLTNVSYWTLPHDFPKEDEGVRDPL